MSNQFQHNTINASKISSLIGPLSWLSIFCLLGALVFLFGGDKTNATPTKSTTPEIQVTDTPVKYKTTAIEDIQIGERLLGKNPIAAEVDDFVPDIIPSQWRLLHLTMHKANGKRLDMQFLRPLDWIKTNGAQLGAIIDLDLPEFGAKGPAKVILIEPCPPIKSGPGNVVTGKFIHESDGNLIDLRIKGQKEPTTVTANHRYWSADRNEFVEAGHLKPGEQVQTLAGLKQVVSITPCSGNETVYNLEVQGEHVYLVGSLGALVHNNYPQGSVKFWDKATDFKHDSFTKLGKNQQKIADQIIDRFQQQFITQGVGTPVHKIRNVRNLKDGLFEIKHKSGVRVYIDSAGHRWGFSNKNDQNKVIQRIKTLMEELANGG